jgi:rubrerythrin
MPMQKKANLEGFDNIADLFTALKASETIHARNFKNVLMDLGVEGNEPPKSEIEVLDTKSNLKQALKVELSEIDKSYPFYIDKIDGENHGEAINTITYAWKAEQQHRDLIKRMKSASGLFFSKIEDELEEADDYFICQRCGSTLMKFPEKFCPICNSSSVSYDQVSKAKDNN